MLNLKSISILALGAVVSSAAMANEYPKKYPFVPMNTSEILNDVERVSEDPDFIRNFEVIVKKKLSKAKAQQQPWTSSYWPLSKGTIADPYENSKIPYYLEFARTHKGVWKKSKRRFSKRVEKKLAFVDEFSQKQLNKMAPSEKYDLLLGDKSFGLTKRLMNYMSKYGADNYFWALKKYLVAGTDTLQLAEQYVAWNWYSDVETALETDIVLKVRLESKMALDLYRTGITSSIEEALIEVTPIAIDQASNYVLADKKVKHIAAWEGICNGWSTAAGLVPRPRKMVSFNLPNTDKKLNFYPDDIKGLVSQYWFNSFIQNNLQRDNQGKYQSGGVISAGLRCNLQKPKKDDYGRYYDSQPDPRSGDELPRCVGVHPAKWHMGLVNIIGKQRRSFIVERKVDDPVDNHPMYKYEMEYFNPNSAETYKNPMNAVIEIDENDQFKAYRNPKAKYIVGVTTTMFYMDYIKPKRSERNSEKDDAIVDKKMFYDLELDADYNIIGGQWRTTEVGKPDDEGTNNSYENHKQPDFFWVITKDWKQSGLFNNSNKIPEWTDTKNLPPASWLEEAKSYHSFNYIESTYYGTGKQCRVRNQITGEVRMVWCEHETNRPQPLPNVINKLIELSSGKSVL